MAMNHSKEQLIARKNMLLGRTSKDNERIIIKLERKIRKMEGAN